MRNRTTIVLVVVLLAIAACEITARRSFDVPGESFERKSGLAAADGLLYVLHEARFSDDIDVLALDGTVVDRLRAPGHFDQIAIADDGSFILIGRGAGFRWDRSAAEAEELFCLVPPPPPEVGSTNAVAVVGDTIIVNPRRYLLDEDPTYEPGPGGGLYTLSSSSIDEYDLASGHLLATDDVTALGVELDGLAIVGSERWGLSKTDEYRTRIDRLDDRGEVLGGVELGVERLFSPSGLAVVDDEVYVLDAGGSGVVVFDVDDVAGR